MKNAAAPVFVVALTLSAGLAALAENDSPQPRRAVDDSPADRDDDRRSAGSVRRDDVRDLS